MNRIIFLLCLVCIVSCNRKPFVNSKLKFEKLSDDCANEKTYFRMVANINGERYEFEECLPADFSTDRMTTSRQGDTVLVQFAKAGAKKALYKMTLDIDSYPRYHFITIGNNTFEVVTTEN